MNRNYTLKSNLAKINYTYEACRMDSACNPGNSDTVVLVSIVICLYT